MDGKDCFRELINQVSNDVAMDDQIVLYEPTVRFFLQEEQ